MYQKKPGSDHFETIGLTDLSKEALDEEVRVLNVYPLNDDVIPRVNVRYLDGRQETISKSALLKVWMEGRYSTRG